MYVKAKKSLGQHFLKDLGVAKRIVESLTSTDLFDEIAKEDPTSKVDVLEVGPGTGVLTQYLIVDPKIRLKVAEIDRESVEYLNIHYPSLGNDIWEGDFLRMDLADKFAGKFFIIGNFPYNISSQIFFKVLDYKDNIPMAVGMIQKEVAERLASAPGKKCYGILSVLLQAWYDIEYLFTVDEHVFSPPPKVKSAVIRIKRNSRVSLGCDEALFKSVIKTSFNQRRKAIRNSIKPLMGGNILPDHFLLGQRPEQLSVEEFVELTKMIDSSINK